MANPPQGFSPWQPAGTYAVTNPDSLQYVGNNQGGYSENPDAPNYHPNAALLNALAAGQAPSTGWMESWGPGMDSAQVNIGADGTASNYAVHNNNDSAFWNAALAAGALTGANIYAANGVAGANALGSVAPESGSYLGGITGTGPGTGMLGATGGGAAGSAAGGLSGGVSSMGAGMGGVTDFLGGISPNTWAQLGSAGIGLISNNRALNAGADANAQSNALLRYMYDTNRADNQPLVDLRNSVLPRINGLLSNPSSITSDPGYQFGLQQGTTALNNSAAARGMTYSGAQGKALQRYGQDYAGSKLDQSLNRLTGVAGLGQVGSNNNQQATTQYGTTAANNALGMGNFRGSAYQQQGNILGNALSGAFNSWQNGDILKNLLGGG